MTGTQYLLAKCGVSSYFWRWVPDDLALVWASWDDAPELVQLLGALFPWDRVAAPIQALAAAAPALNFEAELRHRTPTCLYNCAALLPRAFEPGLVAAYKSLFPLAEVAGKLLEVAAPAVPGEGG